MDDIRSVRRALGLTQTELGDALELNQSTISRLESGSLPVDSRTRLALEALLARREGVYPAPDGPSPDTGDEFIPEAAE